MIAREISDVKELEDIFRLRKRIFVDELAWTKTNNEFESDNHDKYAHHFAVYSGINIAGYVRALPPEYFQDFMIFHEFRKLLPSRLLEELKNWSKDKQSQSIELSRLFVDNKLRGTGTVQFLFKAVNFWAFPKNYLFWHGVMTKEVVNLLSKEGVVVKSIFSGKFPMDNNICTVAYVDVLATKRSLLKSNKQKHDWYFSVN